MCLLSPLVSEAQTAADAYYDPTEMANARQALKAHHGAQLNFLVLGERLEYQSNDGDPLVVWEGQGWLGRDEHKLWLKTEGEYTTQSDRFEEAEIQALYSRAISPFWDLQAGLSHDIKPDPSRSYFVVGLQGLAPYWFELDTALFLSNKGDVSMRLEAEYEFRITQRLILQPRIELNAAFSDDSEIGVGSGLSTAEAGLRLRYEFTRQFAPYIGIGWFSSFGETKDFQRADAEDTDDVSFIAGLRFWF
ncbi:MAG: copper resistance protein B [Gammaproteobacteria bacterium]